jgi:hypothetical protein
MNPFLPDEIAFDAGGFMGHLDGFLSILDDNSISIDSNSYFFGFYDCSLFSCFHSTLICAGVVYIVIYLFSTGAH